MQLLRMQEIFYKFKKNCKKLAKNKYFSERKNTK